MPRHRIETLGFNDLAIDDEWESPSRTVTEADVVGFCGISGDYNPLHIDYESAREGPFGRPVAHGLLGLAVASGLASQAPRVHTLAFLAILEWNFLQPIAFGDTVRVITRVVSLVPQAHRRRGIVTWHRRLVNQKGETVQEGRTQTLVRARPEDPADEPAGPTN